LGNRDYVELPNKQSSPSRKYDSAVDQILNPSIFVVFKDSSAYPAYLISVI